MREGAFLSSKAKGQWRNSLTRLTFTLVNPLGSSEEVKIRPSQCWGWDQLMSEHLCRSGCVRIRGQQQVNPHPCVVVYSKAPSHWRPSIVSVCLCVCKSGNKIGWE